MRGLGTYLLTFVASFALAGAARQHTFLVADHQRAPHTRRHHGWMLITRGGSNEGPQSPSSTGTDSEQEEDSEDETQKEQTDEWSEEVDDDTAETDDDDNLDMFLDAQEFIEEEDVAAEAADKNILEDAVEETIVEAVTISDDAIDDEYEYEVQEGADDSAQTVQEQAGDELNMEEVVEEAVVQGAAVSEDLLDEYEDDQEEDSVEEASPETDFDKQVTPQEDTPSTEDASQVEPEFSPGVETEVMEVVEKESVVESPADVEFDEPTAMSEPSVETVESDASAESIAESMVEHSEIVEEEETPFVATSQTEDTPVEVDLSQQHTTDDDSMAFEDRMQLADDEGEAALTEMAGEEIMEEDEHNEEKAPIIDDSAPTAAAVATDEVVTVDNGNDDILVKTMAVLDDATKQILRKDLKYRRREVNGMKPEIASVLAEKRLRRPCEGIPPNWYTDDAKHRHTIEKNIILKIVTAPIVYAVPIILGSLAIYGSRDVAKMVSTISSSSSDSTPSPPPPDKDEESVEKESILDTFSSTSMNTVESAPPPSTTGSGGIAPYDDSRIPKKDDDTWLDKAIMGILRPFQWFWNIKI